MKSPNINKLKAVGIFSVLAVSFIFPNTSFALQLGGGVLGSDSSGFDFGGGTLGGNTSSGNYGGGTLGGGGNYGGGTLGGGNYGGGTLGGGNYGGGILGSESFNTPSDSYYYPQSSYYPDYSSDCFSCGGDYSYIPSYSYTPSQSYTYVPSSQSVSASNSNYSSNTNRASASNSNSITNNPVNIFEPTNNNDARVNLVVLGGGNNSSQPTQRALDGACTISPNAAYVGQDLQFFANATGGSGIYTYSWTGDNGLYTSAAAFTGKFMYPGTKTASVVITSNGQSITRTCSVNVLDRVGQTVSNSSTSIGNGNPVSGVFLNEVPETGITFSLKMTLFSVGILLWSLFAAYIINAKRSKTLALATNTDVASRIEAFKQRNLARKN